MKKRSFFVILLLLLFSSLCACGKSNKVMISEVYLDSKSEAGWIEIYNYGEDEVDLSGYGLSDSKKEIFRYKFAEGTILPAGECLVVYCEKSAEQKHFYKAGIKLSSKGEDLYLVTAKGKSVHVLSYEKVKDGCSYGCIIDENGEAIWAYCDEVSPGIVNSKKYFAVESPILSYPGGFYDDPISLSVYYREGETVYYTLDGSVPSSENGLVYKNAITIEDISKNENRLSARTDISDYNEVIAPNEPVDKATVIRAVAINESGKQSQVITETYFIGYDKKNSYYKDSLVISIITDEANLFDYEDGIYVLGKENEEWILHNPENEYDWKGWQGANYRLSGRESERETIIEFYEHSGKEYSDNVGIRIRGRWTRCLPQKSFSVFARGEYGDTKIRYDLFDGQAVSEYNGRTIEKYDSFIIRNCGNSSYSGSVLFTRFQDKLNQQLVSDRDFSTQVMRPCIVFINGEYWGQYEMAEKYSAYYLQTHFGVDKDNVCVYRILEIEEGTELDKVYVDEFLQWISESDFSDPEVYAQLEEKVDISSFIDYMASEIYIANGDWGDGNFGMWRYTGEKTDNPYTDGKWRFLMFDTDYGGGERIPGGAKYNNLNNANLVLNGLFEKACTNPIFKKQFVTAFMDIANSCFNYETVLKTVESMSEKYAYYSMDYMKRFASNVDYSLEDYESSVECVLDFYEERTSYVCKYLSDRINLTDCIVAVVVENDDFCGNVTINSITPKMTDGRWSGKYYADYPAEISVKSQNGKQFACFELSDGRKYYDDSVTIELSEDVTISVKYK